MSVPKTAAQYKALLEQAERKEMAARMRRQAEALEAGKEYVSEGEEADDAAPKRAAGRGGPGGRGGRGGGGVSAAAKYQRFNKALQAAEDCGVRFKVTLSCSEDGAFDPLDTHTIEFSTADESLKVSPTVTGFYQSFTSDTERNRFMEWLEDRKTTFDALSPRDKTKEMLKRKANALGMSVHGDTQVE